MRALKSPSAACLFIQCAPKVSTFSGNILTQEQSCVPMWPEHHDQSICEFPGDNRLNILKSLGVKSIKLDQEETRTMEQQTWAQQERKLIQGLRHQHRGQREAGPGHSRHSRVFKCPRQVGGLLSTSRVISTTALPLWEK